MMSKMGAMFVLLLLFTLASSQQEGDVQARKTHPKREFQRILLRSGRKCNFDKCKGTGVYNCGESCSCEGLHSCRCTYNIGSMKSGCACICTYY
uniref:Alpha-conotoxin RVIIIA n=1 Tax=Conus radiatus TaxID=61198 RepID=CSA8A_CONRA